MFPYLDDEDASASRSVGDTSRGRVVNAVAIEESDALAILPRQKERDLAYGTAAMAKLLARAAAALHDATKTKLFIGDVGKKGGGHIRYSVSHNAGRDADVAFSYVDAAGKPVDPPDLVPLGKDGASKDGTLRFDVARTWTTVRALVTSEDAEVQYLFISEPLKKKLLLYARDHKEKPDIVQRAAVVLEQPGGSAPHDDHLHVRIYCSELDVASGCVDTGRIPPDKRSFEAARAERIQHALGQLTGADSAKRARAVLRLGILGATDALPRVAAATGDPAPEVRHAAASVLGAIGGPTFGAPLVQRFDLEDDGRVRLRDLEATVEIGGSDAAQLLCKVIAADAPPPAGPLAPLTDPPMRVDLLDGASLSLGATVEPAEIRAYAVAAAGRLRTLDAMPSLLPLLEAPDADLRARAAETVGLISNFDVSRAAHECGLGATLDAAALAKAAADSDGATWADDTAKDAHAVGRRAYEALWKKLGKSPRDVWLGEGFRTDGFRVRAFDKTSVWELVRASATDGFVGRNARSVLARIANEPEVPWSTPPSEACGYYLDYFKARARRFGLSEPPLSVRAACPLAKGS